MYSDLLECTGRQTHRTNNQVNLKRGQFDTYHFVPPDPPRAVILFGSGDGGWGYIEGLH